MGSFGLLTLSSAETRLRNVSSSQLSTYFWPVVELPLGGMGGIPVALMDAMLPPLLPSMAAVGGGAEPGSLAASSSLPRSTQRLSCTVIDVHYLP